MANLLVIKMNSKGKAVENWQYFLLGQSLYNDVVDGKFGTNTFNATVEFQKTTGLEPDGVVGNKSYGKAMQLGFLGVSDSSAEKPSINWPEKPNFPPLITNEERMKKFGSFTFKAAPLPGNKENIIITDNWEIKNIITFDIPQLVAIKGSPRVRFHKLASQQMIQLWSDWEVAGLLHHVLTWGGSFVPRFVRGSNKTLSNHAFGSAFDINVEWNQRGSIPALVGQKGCVRELVEIANLNGFYWGGHFTKLDGMHFEVARILR